MAKQSYSTQNIKESSQAKRLYIELNLSVKSNPFDFSNIVVYANVSTSIIFDISFIEDTNLQCYIYALGIRKENLKKNNF